MRLLTNLLFKVTLSSMILTAPAMITAKNNYDGASSLSHRTEGSIPFFTATVIKRFVDHPTVIAMRSVPLNDVAAATATTAVPSSFSIVSAAAAVAVEAGKVATTTTARSTESRSVESRSAELRMVIRQASLIYTAMDLQESGLDPKAFEYAWRGYHNLVKKGAIQKTAILSICDFSQSSRNKRMYVIDVLHKRLLYRTYVAHGQNSGDEFASSFSNENDSYKSSLGFYITQKTYVGRNGLSLRLYGVDKGYNDQAVRRKIVLHGSPYVGDKYMQEYGNLGTSLGCPALPIEVSGRIIRTVKDGSCLFIYHPTQQYLDNSTILHG